ncbi:MAG: hypothetical protein [Caudoviricetes sp.]|nr:MAG: hypothetical protein [Caudoviricetes sp.]
MKRIGGTAKIGFCCSMAFTPPTRACTRHGQWGKRYEHRLEQSAGRLDPRVHRCNWGFCAVEKESRRRLVRLHENIRLGRDCRTARSLHR